MIHEDVHHCKPRFIRMCMPVFDVQFKIQGWSSNTYCFYFMELKEVTTFVSNLVQSVIIIHFVCAILLQFILFSYLQHDVDLVRKHMKGIYLCTQQEKCSEILTDSLLIHSSLHLQ